MARDIQKLILQKVARKDGVTVAEIVAATGFSRGYVHRFFRILQDEGKIVLMGRANSAKYVSATKKALAEAKKKVHSFRKLLKTKGLTEDAILSEIQNTTGIFIGLPENVAHILEYGFTEMLNNAIEHSRSKTVEVFMKRHESGVAFTVTDSGVGIFRNIVKKKNLRNEMEAIQDLLKGKQTTAPREHSGEGIFFTSKAADLLFIQSSKKRIEFRTLLDDVFVKDTAYEKKGTKVIFDIGLGSRRELQDVFAEYTTGDSFEFRKTKVVVRLYKMDTGYISRSQARRVVSGLEAFKTIVLDFVGVDTVGQGFADEVFRVWKQRHPSISIQHRNANENVLFMIERAMARAR